MEDIIRQEKSRRSRESASRDVIQLVEDEDESQKMGDIAAQVHNRIEQLSAGLEDEKKQFDVRLEQEMSEFMRKQKCEKDRMTERHDRDKSSLAAKHSQVSDNSYLLTKQMPKHDSRR